MCYYLDVFYALTVTSLSVHILFNASCASLIFEGDSDFEPDFEEDDELWNHEFEWISPILLSIYIMILGIIVRLFGTAVSIQNMAIKTLDGQFIKTNKRGRFSSVMFKSMLRS